MASPKELTGSWEFEFPVNHFSSCGDYVRSPPLRIGSCEFCLKVYPSGSGSSLHLGAFVELLPDLLWREDWMVHGFYTIKVCHEEVDKCIVKEDCHIFREDAPDSGWHDLLLSSGREGFRDAGFLFSGHMLKLSASVRYMSGAVHPVKTGLSGSACMWAERKWTDMTVSARDGEKIPCHRAVLANSSPVFERMLSGGFKESVENHVTLPEVSHAVAYAFVAFLYMGALPTHTDVISLVSLADMYEIQPLSEVCLATLRTTGPASVGLTMQRLLQHPAESLCGRCRRLFVDSVLESWCKNSSLALADYLVESGNSSFLKAIARQALSDERSFKFVIKPVLKGWEGHA